jgi:hypothetical protein
MNPYIFSVDASKFFNVKSKSSPEFALACVILLRCFLPSSIASSAFFNDSASLMYLL